MKFNLRLSATTITLLSALILLPSVFGFYYVVEKLESKQQQQSLQNRAENQLQKIESAFLEIIALLRSARSLIELYPELTREEFSRFIYSHPLSDYGITAYEWIPKIPIAKLALWEKNIRSSGQFDFLVNFKANKQNTNITDVFPILYRSSSRLGEANIGDNLAQHEQFSPLILKATQLGSTTLGISNRLNNNELGTLDTSQQSRFMLAAYKNNKLDYNHLLGIVSVAIDLEETINILLGSSLNDLGLCLVVRNKQLLPNMENTLYHSSGKNTQQKCQIDEHSTSSKLLYNLAGQPLVFDFYNLHSNKNDSQFTTSQLALFSMFMAVILGLSYIYSSRRYSLRIEKLITLEQHRLRDMTNDYAKLFTLSVDGIYKATLKGKLIKANPAFAQAFGYTTDNDICQHIEHINQHLYQNADDFDNFIEKLLEDGQVINFEWKANSRHEETVWLTENAYLIQDSNGHPSHYEGFISVISDRKIAETRLIHQAQHDPLTGLLNRTAFVDAIDQHIRQYSLNHCAVFFIDIDRFKTINDSFGHATGDKLLIEVANRLTTAFRTECIARFGGDEFAVFCTNIAHKSDLEQQAQLILDSIDKVFYRGHSTFNITASVGASLLTATCNSSSEALHQADLAMYQVKQNGRANKAIYDTTLSLHVQRRLSLEVALKDALKNREFHLHYQPILSLKTKKIRGFEALLRWSNTTLGQVNPDEFIPILEELNLISAVGDWVMYQAIRELKTLIKQSLNQRIFMNINVSPKQFINTNIAQRITDLLNEFKLKGENLHIEITETQIYSDETQLIAQLQTIKDANVGIFIDDFGTGQSSLGRLVNYPLDGIKLDRSFVKDLQLQSNNAIVLKAAIHMADLLGLSVTAEGIEEQYQADFFNTLGCEYGQGYLFYRPIPAATARELIFQSPHYVA